MSRDQLHDEIHPEELIAKAATRALEGEEAADLEAHLRRCPACALHVSLRGDVARALAPTDADHEVGARAVQRLLDATGQTPPLSAARRRRAPTVARAAIITAVILGTSAATAALVWRARSKQAATTVAAVRAEPAHGRTARAEPPLAAPAPEPLPTEDLGVPAPAPSPAPIEITPAPVSAQAPVRRAPAYEPAPAAAIEPVAEERAVAQAEPPAQTEPTLAAPLASTAEARPAVDETSRTAPPTEPRETAGALFETAERAKRGGDAREAERAYARLAAAFPGTREEIAARPLRGQILLDDLGRPEDALASFQRYLRDKPTGVLSEEARAGRAEALRQLGRSAEEAEAWRDLLAHHARSVYASRARDRLAKLAETLE